MAVMQLSNNSELGSLSQSAVNNVLDNLKQWFASKTSKM